LVISRGRGFIPPKDGGILKNGIPPAPTEKGSFEVLCRTTVTRLQLLAHFALSNLPKTRHSCEEEAADCPGTKRSRGQILAVKTL
jgi:hypothetical protein